MGGKGSGGNRAGAGRPKTKVVQLQEAKALVKELQQLVKGGLTRAALQLDALIEEELTTAFTDPSAALRQKARHYLMDILFRSVKLSDSNDSHPLIDKLMQWNSKGDIHIHGGPDVATEDGGPVVDASYRALP